jgi:hypothetical protein
MLNYWHPLETLDSTFQILQDAYITSKTLFKSKTTSWYGSVHTILEQIPEIKNLDQLYIKLSSFKNKAKIHLKSKFIELWRDQMLQQTNGKLRSYITFKFNFGREKYLSVLKSFEQRRCLTQLCIPCHQLKGDFGHFQVYYSEIENDICLPLPQRSNTHIFYLVGEYPGIYQSQFSIDDREYIAV